MTVVRKVNAQKLLVLAACIRKIGEVIDDIDRQLNRKTASVTDNKLIELHNEATAFKFKLIDELRNEHKLENGKH